MRKGTILLALGALALFVTGSPVHAQRAKVQSTQSTAAVMPPGAPVIREQIRPDGLIDLAITHSDGGEITRYTANLKDNHRPAMEKTPAIARWESWRYGGFVCFNDNQFMGSEYSKNKDSKAFNPSKLDVAGWVTAMKKGGMKYAVLTTRHTSGFLLWDSATSLHDVGSSPGRPDVAGQFVKECRRQGVVPGFYYCLWGAPKSTMPYAKARPIILAQLHELASRFGEIPYFWIDMKNWSPADLSTQEIYDLLKNFQPATVVIMNQHIQDGSKIAYFPTDVLNGEVVTPPEKGHQAIREVEGKKYYLPFEFEPVSQQREKGTVTPLGRVGVWFTYGEGLGFAPSRPLPVPVLFDWIKQAYDRGAGNVLLSLAPDHTGAMRPQDSEQLADLGRRLRRAKLIE